MFLSSLSPVFYKYGKVFKKNLVEKLGIKENERILILNEPEQYLDLLIHLPKSVSFSTTPGGKFHFIHLFTTKKSELEKMAPFLKESLVPNGMFWISWPKQNSKKETDVNENYIREIGLQNGLVDIKVIAVDEVWSGLKFVFRLKDRNT